MMANKSGIFLINKPQNITSNDLIQKIKKKLGIDKIGHAGTLDPLATGLMVILVNQATKISNYLLSSDKSYVVTMKLFVQTDSQDITGNIVEEETYKKISKSLVKEIIKKYNGYIYDQYPPVYSAVKVDGKKLYEYARKNQEVVIKPRKVTIKECELIEFNQKLGTIKLKVRSSKGTYIRSLVSDIAKDLETIATVSQLERVSSGGFLLENAKTIEEIEFSDLINMYDSLMINEHPIVEYHRVRDIKQGKTITLTGINYPIVFIIDDQKTVIAIYKHIAHDLYKCQRGLWDEIPLEQLTEAERNGYYD
ncbi:tRNA pseudouridine(55) synthase TruB [Spiroplasma floricola]|uniref:tRNA pseudouridine synthase B n=1 Tax=Spiroplasma floricola 23-6 TaxID=1336749 RepID=A0A2K8SDC4_9MOLU|nr:tRNA pseudouridine(55) synthase TruB [Spiroplasma floricola]AUB31459.1 tRNA pseudouridine synthase B [Spiroplasma floricola 23-6]